MSCCAMGSFRDKVIILTRVLATADGTGEQVESWPDPAAGTNEHWASIESPGSGELLNPVRESFATYTVRFRHQVTLTAVDKVRVKEWDEDFQVSGVRRERGEDGRWQTVCTLVG